MHVGTPAPSPGAARSRRRAWLAVLGLVLTVAFAACGSGDDSDDPGGNGSFGTAPGAPDTSPEGQVRYACSLTEHIRDEHGDPGEWTALIGPDAEPGAREAGAVGSLLGGSAGYELPDQPELSEAGKDLISALSRVDVDRTTSALDAVAAGCEDVPGRSADVSDEGQVEFACALAHRVVDENGKAETWDGLGQEPAWHEAGSAGALAGGLNASVVPGGEKLSEPGQDIFASVARLDTDRMDEALDAFVTTCDG